MQHYWSLEDVQLEDTWLTIGSFDGVHLGHQRVVRELVAGAHEVSAPVVVLTFYPHPATVLRGYDYPFYLTTPEERANLLGELGVDVVVTHPFDETVAATSARDFMAKLHKHLGIHHLQVGYDFALGKDRTGTPDSLRELGDEFGYSLTSTDSLNVANDVVSSSRIRFLLGAGQVDQAAKLLGRNYAVEGEIVVGDRRGATLGFPTANMDIWPEQAIPAAGVYVCRAEVRGQSWDAVTNIGVRPTFESSPVPPRVEAHLLDFDEDIYGETLHLDFRHRLRGEQRFPNIDALVTQIQTDVQQARKMLAS
ncbi:MAG: bifunctional riboflavin kinase/FAD synthetase [Anaerolineales bacterium]|nr:bifunctional riboflavin kinase/FAD synthetase [Anaerolineales bacterium]